MRLDEEDLVGTRLHAHGAVQVTIESSDRIAKEVGELVETVNGVAM
jgi:hypothetical protein